MSFDTPVPDTVKKAADSYNNQRSYLDKRKQRFQELDELIQTAEGYLQDEEGEPILLFPDHQKPDRQNREIQSKYAANIAFDGLMDTLLGITEFSSEQAKRMEGVEKYSSQNYERVARAMIPLVQVWSTFARDELPLLPDYTAEQRFVQYGDRVYIYNTQQSQIGPTDFQNISVFIRPNKFESTDRPKEPRLTLRVSPASSPESGITMRIDYDNLENINQQDRAKENGGNEDNKSHELTFDLEIGGESDILDTYHLRFPDQSKNHMIRQRQGHHFSTNINEEDLGVDFSDLLEAMVDKAEENVTTNGKTKQSAVKK